jgi:hypothetical protein
VELRMRPNLVYFLFRSMGEIYFCVNFEIRYGRLKPLQSFWHTLHVVYISRDTDNNKNISGAIIISVKKHATITQPTIGDV